MSKPSKSCVTCPKSGCNENLILTKSKDFYGFFDQWRICSNCWKGLFSNDTFYVCPKGHLFNTDSCLECEQELSDARSKTIQCQNV